MNKPWSLSTRLILSKRLPAPEVLTSWPYRTSASVLGRAAGEKSTSGSGLACFKLTFRLEARISSWSKKNSSVAHTLCAKLNVLTPCDWQRARLLHCLCHILLVHCSVGLPIVCAEWPACEYYSPDVRWPVTASTLRWNLRAPVLPSSFFWFALSMANFVMFVKTAKHTSGCGRGWICSTGQWFYFFDLVFDMYGT